MKVLWICNIVLPYIAEKLKVKSSFGSGWLVEMSKQIRDSGNELIFCAPCLNHPKPNEQSVENINVALFSPKENLELFFTNLINKHKPDVIHLFGTECSHALPLVKAAQKCNMLEKTVVGIQGLVSVCARHFFAGLDYKTIHSYTLRDIVRRNNIYQYKLLFERSGKKEEMVLRLARHVIGRTDWDKACVTRINSRVNYHFCNETLRKAFYQNEWNIDRCEKYSIFVSQSNYPLKGFHHMLEAMADIIKEYPNAHLYTTGKNPLVCTFKQKMLQSYYSRYIGKLIKKYKLENNVTFLGYLDEQKMCEQYLKSNVFVCCSSIENSPNSLGEAMILGVPCVSSDIGGVKNMMEHNKEGFVYQSDAPYMLSYYVKEIFTDEKLALEFSKNAKKHAEKTHDSEKNFEDLMKIYNQISK